MQITGPRISVVTVCFNSAETLESTILSVLNQTYPNVEYIVIDGGSTDGTVDIIKKYADRIAYWVSEPDNGIYDAMNKGVRAATGDYMNFMNAGDGFYDNGVIERCVPYLNTDPDVAFGSVYGISPTGDNAEVKPDPFYTQKRKRKYPGICHQSTFVKAALQRQHGFDTRYSIAADFNLLSIIYNNGGKFLEIPHCIATYETTGFSTKNHRQRMREFAEISGLDPDSLRVRVKIATYSVKLFIMGLFGK